MTFEEKIWDIIGRANEKDELASLYESERDEILLELRGLELDEEQIQAISGMNGYVAYELTEE